MPQLAQAIFKKTKKIKKQKRPLKSVNNPPKIYKNLVLDKGRVKIAQNNIIHHGARLEKT